MPSTVDCVCPERLVSHLAHTSAAARWRDDRPRTRPTAPVVPIPRRSRLLARRAQHGYVLQILPLVPDGGAGSGQICKNILEPRCADDNQRRILHKDCLKRANFEHDFRAVYDTVTVCEMDVPRDSRRGGDPHCWRPLVLAHSNSYGSLRGGLGSPIS
jgi:hypothetical protein